VPDSIHTFTSALAAGEARAVEQFYCRYFDVLYGHARRATRRDEAFCLDIVQESVLRVLRAVRPAHCEAQFAAWLRLVVQTTAFDLLRSESRRRRREVAAVAASQGRDEAEVDPGDEERMTWLRAEIAGMDPQIVRMIEMRFERRWTLARISEALGLTIGTIDGRLRRALSDLRERASEEFDE
jgi:RNA polymerase sigma factor (sigma-70 family)